MLRRLLCFMALVLVAVPGCGDGGAEVSKKQFALLGELRDTLTKVTDDATLKAQLPKLEDISKQLAAAQAELNKQQVSTEQQRDLRAKYGKDLETLQKDLETQVDRLDKLPDVDEKERDKLVAALTAASTGTMQ
jgi:septal ring factor EnvC (AmiA/AmiB activator)